MKPRPIRWPVGRMAAVLFLCLPLFTTRAASSLLFDPPVVEFGDVFEHQHIHTNVLVINAGDEPVRINRLGRTCPDCLTTSMDEMNLPPGAAGRIAITLCPDTGPGFFDELVTVEVEQGPAPALPVQARVHPSYELDGAPFLLTATDENETLTHVVHITPVVGMKGRLTAPTNNPYFTVDVQPGAATGTYVAAISVKRPIPSGMSHETLRLPSTHEDDPPCWMDLAVFLPPPVHVYPSRLLLAPADRQQLRILFIEQRLDPPARIVDVRVPSPSFTWELIPGFSLERSRINVYVYHQGGKSGPQGDLVLVTDRAEQPEIRIPVMVDDAVTAGSAVNEWAVPVGNKRGCGCAASM